MTLIVLLCASTLSFSGLGWALKNFAKSEPSNWLWLVPAVLFAVLGNALYIQILRAQDIGVATVLSALAQIIVMGLIGRFYFHETLSNQQMIGIGFAMIAMTLFMLPTTR